ncbi:MAG TPA: BrnT family toxin [Pyrinomonadaceae bacterium]
MEFEWDRKKAENNLKLHGVSFDEAMTVFDDPLFLTFADPDHSEEEQRFMIMGESSNGKLLVVAHAKRSQVTRLISARKATRKERKSYEEDI